MSSQAVTAFHFGPAHEPLFGCFHPGIGAPATFAALLCQPIGIEYDQAHRAHLRLATRLARRGVPTLRFDFFGCGDSAGDLKEASVPRWRDDVRAALAHLRRCSGVEDVVVCGSRFGGSLTLAALAEAAGAERIGALALWDPIVRGGAWLDELAAWERDLLVRAHVTAPPRGNGFEALGSSPDASLLAEIRSFDLRTAAVPLPRALLVESHRAAGDPSAASHIEGLTDDLRVMDADDHGLWKWKEDAESILVPARLLEDIVAWVRPG